MYNTLFGINNLAPLATAACGVPIEEIERFRDAIFKKGDGYPYENVIEILTRTGGPNKEAYPNKSLKQSANFIECYDDPYDNTYEHIILKIDNAVYLILDYDKIYNEQTRNSLNLKDMFEKEYEEMGIEGTDAYNRAQKIANGIKKIVSNASGKTSYTWDEIMDEGDEEK